MMKKYLLYLCVVLLGLSIGVVGAYILPLDALTNYWIAPTVTTGCSLDSAKFQAEFRSGDYIQISEDRAVVVSGTEAHLTELPSEDGNSIVLRYFLLRENVRTEILPGVCITVQA